MDSVEYEEQYELDLLRKRALKAREIIVQLLQDRGYEIKKKYLKISTVLPKASDLYLEGDSESLGRIGVFWSMEDKYRMEEARSLILALEEKQLKRAILLTPEGDFTASTKDVLFDLIKNKKILLQMFTFDELQYNPIQHTLVPKYKILNEEEKGILKESYMLNDLQQLPVLAYSDIFSRYLGLHPNTVVQFSRRDGSITYRIVL